MCVSLHPELLTPTCLMCDHICDCYYYWSLLGRVCLYVRSLFLYFRRLLDLVGYERFSPTSWLLVWCVVEIFSQQFVSLLR
jgi:hypothetical protein